MPRNLRDAVVLVTGASSGIGRMTALRMAQAGARLVLLARRQNRLEAAVKEIEARGGTATAFPGDVTVASTMRAAVQSCVSRFGRLDVLVNNAGAGLFATTEQTTEEELDRML